MSVVGKTVAVVSLGSSCQPSHQLKLHAPLLCEILGEEVAPRRLPFDWVICPVAAASAWLRHGPDFPAAPADLAALPGAPSAFHWRARSLYFWHDFMSEGRVDVDGSFDEVRQRYARSFDRLRRLGELDRVVAVVCNTQNNLPIALGPAYDSSAFELTLGSVQDLKRAFEQVIGRDCEMLCVTYPDRASQDLASLPDQRLAVEWLMKDASQWEGDPWAWRELLERNLR